MNDLNKIKISSFISSQFPSFIVSDKRYSSFVSFLEAYFEWMEQKGQPLYESRRLLDYIDVDKTLEEFIDHFYEEFLPSFPKEILVDKRKLLKFSKELYQSKGTNNSYKLLFRILYDSDCEIVETKDYILRASAGKWFAPKSIKINSLDERFVNSENFFVFGETSKTFAKIERVKVVSDKIEIFISDIERVFEVGEQIRIVDFRGNDVFFDQFGNVSDFQQGDVLRASIISPISNVDIDSKNRGNYYNSGNPVVFFGGIKDLNSGIGATATVGSVTNGSIQRALIDESSPNFGYRSPYTAVFVDPDPNKSTHITVGAVDPSSNIYLDYIITNSLELVENIPLYCDANTGFSTNTNSDYSFTNFVKANANTIMAQAFTFSGFSTFSVDNFVVNNGGGGFSSFPTLSPESMYQTNLPLSLVNIDPRYNFDVGNPNPKKYAELGLLGILTPIKIISGGLNFEANDEIIFTGGYGTGAFAKVTSVESNGQIKTVSYYSRPDLFVPIGGIGYSEDSLPTISVKGKEKLATINTNSNLLVLQSPSTTSNIKIGQIVSGNGISSNVFVQSIDSGNNKIFLTGNSSSNIISNTFIFNGTGASLVVEGIMGSSLRLNPTTDRIGAIINFNISNYGEDYSSAPSVSLRVQDIAVSNVSPTKFPQKGDVLFAETYSYRSTIDSIFQIESNINPLLSKYIIRTYNYSSILDTSKELILKKTSIPSPNTVNLKIETSYVFPAGYFGIPNPSLATVTFGDGKAKGFVKFLNGLILGQGRYLDEKHQPSSYSILQNEDYNNFTYILTVEKEISKYKDILLDLLHPAGTKVIGQTLIKSTPKQDLDKGKVEFEFVNSLTTDFEFIYMGIATEENSIANVSESRFIGWQDSIVKYAKKVGNNSIIISKFPSEISVGKYIWNESIPQYSVITEVDFENSKITISNNCISSLNSTIFVVNNVVDFSTSLNYKLLDFRISGNTFIGSNVIHITIPSSTNALSGIIKNQIITSDKIFLTANIFANSNVLVNVVNTSPISVGQLMISDAVPSNTTIVSYNVSSKTITLSNKATKNSNSFIEYYNTFVGNTIRQNNFIQFSIIPESTKIIAINSGNGLVTLSNNISGNPTSNLYYFVGDNSSIYGGNNYLIIRTEPGAVQENII